MMLKKELIQLEIISCDINYGGIPPFCILYHLYHKVVSSRYYLLWLLFSSFVGGSFSEYTWAVIRKSYSGLENLDGQEMPPKINLLNLSPRSWLTLITWRGLKSQKIVQFRMTTLIEFAHKLFLDFLRYFSIFSLLVLLLYIYWLIVMKKDRKEQVMVFGKPPTKSVEVKFRVESDPTEMMK